MSQQKIINNILADKWHQGVVIKGKGRGKKLGFPTVNLRLSNSKILKPLKYGVYSCQVKIDNQICQGLFHYGPRPTFKEKKPVLEIHVLNFNKQIKTGTKIKFKLLKYLRKTKRFKNEQELIIQIKNDIMKTRQYFKGEK